MKLPFFGPLWSHSASLSPVSDGCASSCPTAPSCCWKQKSKAPATPEMVATPNHGPWNTWGALWIHWGALYYLLTEFALHCLGWDVILACCHTSPHLIPTVFKHHYLHFTVLGNLTQFDWLIMTDPWIRPMTKSQVFLLVYEGNYCVKGTKTGPGTY